MEDSQLPTGPLAGLRIVEMAGIGPAPFACMLFSDMGAEVVTIQRKGTPLPDDRQIVQRGRTVVTLDLKLSDDRDNALRLIDRAHVLVEGFRPGVMERLGLGPDETCERNPVLVYARMTGWGQHGPLAMAAGHDINYIAITGALDAIGPAGQPVPPLNLVGDYGAGSLYLVSGVLAALYEARTSGRGQVIDVAITDGAVNLMSNEYGRRLRGLSTDARASNLLDGGAPFYRTYRTSDGGFLSIGPIEPQFFAELCERVGLPEELRDSQNDRHRWNRLTEAFEDIFASRPLFEWADMLEGTDCCVAAVLPLSSASSHPHHVARDAFVEVDGLLQPAPAPRFSRTPSTIQRPPAARATPWEEVARRWATAH